MSNMVAADESASISVWRASLSIIDKPQATFASLLAFPRLKWLFPASLSVVILLVSVWVTAPYSSELAQEVAERQWQSMGLTPEQINEFRDQAEQFISPLFIGLQGSIIGAIGMVVVWLIMATLFYFVSIITGAEPTFGGVFLVVTWSYLPLTLRSLIQTIYIAVTGSFPVYPGLAALQVSGDPLKDGSNPLVALLGFIDPFWIWHIVLLVIGLAVAARFSNLKAFMIVLIYGILSIGLSAGLTQLGQLFGAAG